MPNKTLSPEEARNLLVSQIVSSHNNQSDNWPLKEDKLLLHEAATKKRKFVTFSDGRKYSIRYARQKSIAWGGGEGYEVVFIKPTEGPLIPCGWFHIKFLLANNDNA